MPGEKNEEDSSGIEPTEIHTDPNEGSTNVPEKTQEDSEIRLSVDGTGRRTTPLTKVGDGPDHFELEPNRTWIGRYRVESTLGKGGFGQVYLARDDELRRHVTIKIPHSHRISSPEDVDAFLDEARTLAKLEHPNVVPVHDVGHTEDGTCFIVSRYIDGSDLYKKTKQSPLPLAQAIELIATIAEALHYVHSVGVIHRDIKPNNILLDKRDTAYLADFGLALLEEDAARTSRIAGTPAYMSPEQARGENHLVTAKSDIFSLGIVLYELIAGKRPFAGKNSFSVLRLIQEQEAQPPSELNSDISPELERICLKALSKRASSRYPTALNFANDLRYLLRDPHQAGVEQLPPSAAGQIALSEGSAENSQANRKATGLTPRGLRSFGSQDAHFFNDLLPGPYDRDGIPESILFWQRRIEERDPESTFRVGLIYGPSGCGKSSFCKAGLLPTLDSDVIPIFVEAAPDATETRLLNRLRRKCPYLSTDLDLRESIAALRNQHVMGKGTKVLLIVDQFEQWLYSTAQPEHSELAKSLRQCDGEHVQCILLVRDDFWLAFSRFTEHIEIDLLQNHNMAMIDLFDIDHAKMVLREFGRAFERLPRSAADMSRDENTFVNQAIDGLAENGKVIPVRIALFAEMVKTRPWTNATLKQIGGTKGVGVLFLEENFSSSNAPAEHAVHLDAVYATLGALLPQPGTNLKGHMRSREELLVVSGYSEQPKQFQSLIRTLDNELHLITRTTPSGRGDVSATQSGSFASSKSGMRSGAQQSSELVQGEYYQLAHDYLVPAIREWQIRMQRGTAKGRAELRMSQRAEVWGARPEPRHLPTMAEWASMHAFTSKSRWNETERNMMRSAGRRHGLALVAALLVMVLAGIGFRQFSHWNEANTLAQKLEVATPAELPGLLDAIEKNGSASRPALVSIQANNARGTAKHLFACLALRRIEKSATMRSELVETIKPALLDSEPQLLQVVLDELAPYEESLSEYLWTEAAKNPPRTKDSSGRSYHPRLNALLALAEFDPPIKSKARSKNWDQHVQFIVDELVHSANTDRSNFSPMVELARPLTDTIIEPLAEVMIPVEDSDSLSQSAAQDLLVRFLENRVIEYVDILLGAEVPQLLGSIDLIDQNKLELRPLFEEAVQTPIRRQDANWKAEAQRKATAAALLLRHNVTTPEVWAVLVPDTESAESEVSESWMRSELERLLAPLHFERFIAEADSAAIRERYQEATFGRSSVPNARTRMVQRVSAFEVPPLAMARKLLVEQGLQQQCGLLFALGDLPQDGVDASLRNQVITLVKGWMMGAETGQLRSAAFWFLKQWGESEWADEQFRLPSQLRGDSADWYVNSIGQTMVRLPKHQEDAAYRIEIAASEISLSQLKLWKPNGREGSIWKAGSDACAVGNMTYHEAVAYCNWLSRKEGLDENQLCYPDREEGEPTARLYDDYRDRTGYRLPMAEEWFFACNGGAITDYSFGSSLDGPQTIRDGLDVGFSPISPTNTASSWPVGAARPNAFGLFDMYINVREWANDIDPDEPTRVQVCGYDFRYHLGNTGVDPRFLGWSEPGSSRSHYGIRLIRSLQDASDRNTNAEN
ncbi:MAG: protein kinase [Planctomycetota bacterium]